MARRAKLKSVAFGPRRAQHDEMRSRRWLGLVSVALLSLGCATGAPPAGASGGTPSGGQTPARSASAPAPRVKDSVPDKIAATRAASGLQLEDDDERWSIDAARERQRERTDKKAATNVIPMPSPTGAPAPGPSSGTAGASGGAPADTVKSTP
jgi:hypothetical protein